MNDSVESGQRDARSREGEIAHAVQCFLTWFPCTPIYGRCEMFSRYIYREILGLVSEASVALNFPPRGSERSGVAKKYGK